MARILAKVDRRCGCDVFAVAFLDRQGRVLASSVGRCYEDQVFTEVNGDRMSMSAYLISPPAVISFSGGRTSAFMLFQILQAHGGTLPDGVRAVFANTGREMPATLDFVRDCSEHWGVDVVWLEFTARRPGGFKIVDYETAARDGEPFANLLAAQPALPNPVARSCTAEMKIRTIKRWANTVFGKDATPWQVLGLRADEPRRVERALDPARQKKMGREYRNILLPLATAQITKADVLAFWQQQNFDLRLAGPWEGNCDGCFLKSRAAIMRMQRDHPERMRWWPAMEAMPRGSTGNGRYFRIDREPYAVLADLVRNMPMLPLDETMHEMAEPCDGGCGI